MTRRAMNIPVFVNFRGNEIRHAFLSHLVAAFVLQGINFFIDKDEQKGKDLTHLFKRIEESQIALAIFSGRYAQSKWCLNELAKMKELAEKNNLKVIPIFYKVKVDDVRNQNGKFGLNFWKLARASSGEEIKKWKEALEFVSYKMGLTLYDNSSEADFVKEIIEELVRTQSRIPIQERKDHTLDLSSRKRGRVMSELYEVPSFETSKTKTNQRKSIQKGLPNICQKQSRRIFKTPSHMILRTAWSVSPQPNFKFIVVAMTLILVLVVVNYFFLVWRSKRNMTYVNMVLSNPMCTCT